MDLLQEHFARVAAARQAGVNIRRGVFIDIMGTAVTSARRGEEVIFRLNRPVINFARWVSKTGALDGPLAFSSDVDEAQEVLASLRLEPEGLGAEKIKHKGKIYERARGGFSSGDIGDVMARHVANARNFWNPALFWLERTQINLEALSETFSHLARPHKLELVIDDAITPEQEALVISHWNPKDEDVQKFLQSRAYAREGMVYESP